MRTFLRSLPVIAGAALLGMLGVSCGSDDDKSATTEAPSGNSTVPGAVASTPAPPTQPSTTPAPTAPPTTNTKATLYKVKPNDSLIRIAKRFCVKVDGLLYVNRWKNGIKHVLHPKDVIVIPPNACRDGDAGDYVPPTTRKP